MYRLRTIPTANFALPQHAAGKNPHLQAVPAASLPHTLHCTLFFSKKAAMFTLLCALTFSSLVSSATSYTLCGWSTYKPKLNETCSTLSSSTGTQNLDTARGELESFGVLVDNSASTTPLLLTLPTITWEGNGTTPPSGVSATPYFLTYMHTEKSPRYAGSAAGWYAESLLPWPTTPGITVPGSSSLSVVWSFNVSAGATPGVFNGSVSVGSGPTLPFSLTVWGLTIPSIASSPFKTIYAFSSSVLNTVYKPLSPEFDFNSTQERYYADLAAARFPSTNIYAQKPLELWEYQQLASLGSNVLILADISSLPFEGGGWQGGKGRRQRERQQQLQHSSITAGDSCPTFSPAYIASMVQLLNATWVGLGKLGLQQYATVYGFDEIDASCEPSVRQLFTAAKAAFPGVKTLSAIDWASVPLDLPLDTWILQYQLVTPAIAQAWVGAGHELGVYHCIEPSQPGYLNTFVERDLIEARLLFWYDYLLGVTSHLYYVSVCVGWPPLQTMLPTPFFIATTTSLSPPPLSLPPPSPPFFSLSPTGCCLVG